MLRLLQSASLALALALTLSGCNKRSHPFGADDEAPIRVRNGSVILHAAYVDSSGTPGYKSHWVYVNDCSQGAGDNCWSHEPITPYDDPRQEKLWVKVFGTGVDQLCNVLSADANKVEFDFNDGGTVDFKRGQKNSDSNYRVQVRPRDTFMPVSADNYQIQRPDSSGQNYVNKLRTMGTTSGPNMKCEFNRYISDLKIAICSEEQICRNETAKN